MPENVTTTVLDLNSNDPRLKRPELDPHVGAWLDQLCPDEPYVARAEVLADGDGMVRIHPLHPDEPNIVGEPYLVPLTVPVPAEVWRLMRETP